MEDEMGLSKRLGRDSVLIYSAQEEAPEKDTVLRALCRSVAPFFPESSASQIEQLVQKRESTLSTRIGNDLAVPHAVIPGARESHLAAALIARGIDWDGDLQQPVSLVFLLVGGQEEHLSRLSELAALLQEETFLDKLRGAESAELFIQRFREKEVYPAKPLYHRSRDLSAQVFHQALELQGAIDGSRLILHADAVEDGEYIEHLVAGSDVLIVSSSGERFREQFVRDRGLVVLPFKGIKRSTHVQLTLLYLMGKGLVGRDDIVVNVYGKPDSGFFDSIRLSHLARELDFPFASQEGELPDDLHLSALARVLQLAVQLSIEGREGKPLGTLFVLGDLPGVRPFLRQMIVNPFYGYQRDERNILDPSIEETIKEYARIDGAFIIDGDGTIESAGTYLSGQPTAEEMQSGLGARHAAAQGITAVSRAISVVISESTRKITVFQSGRRVMEI